MYCRNCGSEVNEKAIACPKCGVAPFSEKKFCQECGCETKENQMVCIKCGVKLITKGSGASLGDLNLDLSALKNFDSQGVLNSSLMKPISIVSAIAMVILLFLPWYSWHAGGYGSEGSGSINALQGISVGEHWELVKSVRFIGVIMLLFSIGCVAVNFIKFKWAIALGAVNVLLAISWITSLPSGELRSGDFQSNIGVAWGAYLFFIAALAFVVSNVKTLKNE